MCVHHLPLLAARAHVFARPLNAPTVSQRVSAHRHELRRRRKGCVFISVSLTFISFTAQGSQWI
jgi:hypothetical protein